MAFFHCQFSKVILLFLLIFFSLGLVRSEEVLPDNVSPASQTGESKTSEEPLKSKAEEAIDPKVAEIVKNPVNADLNKLPSDVIEKIAEGGVTPAKIEAAAAAAEAEAGTAKGEEMLEEEGTTSAATAATFAPAAGNSSDMGSETTTATVKNSSNINVKNLHECLPNT